MGLLSNQTLKAAIQPANRAGQFFALQLFAGGFGVGHVAFHEPLCSLHRLLH
jgi:hypothetical protein